MTIVTWIRVHPYKVTHFENRKSTLHFIAFMVLHKDSHHNCHRPTKFVSKHWYPNDCFSSADKQHFCSLHYFVRSYCFSKIRPNSTGVMWIKMEWSGDCFSPAKQTLWRILLKYEWSHLMRQWGTHCAKNLVTNKLMTMTSCHRNTMTSHENVNRTVKEWDWHVTNDVVSSSVRPTPSVARSLTLK